MFVLKPFRHAGNSVRELIQTRYGFLLVYCGSPPEDALPLFGEHFGNVLDNPDFLFMPLRVPFGGRKASGWILERQDDTWVERNGTFIYSSELARGVRTDARLPEGTTER